DRLDVAARPRQRRTGAAHEPGGAGRGRGAGVRAQPGRRLPVRGRGGAIEGRRADLGVPGADDGLWRRVQVGIAPLRRGLGLRRGHQCLGAVVLRGDWRGDAGLRVVPVATGPPGLGGGDARRGVVLHRDGYLDVAPARSSAPAGRARRRMNNHVRELRGEQGWSQADLAERLEVSRQTINAIETGKYDPSLPLAFKIAKLFGRPIEAIFE